MVHERQRLSLGLEARQHVARIHAGFDEFESDLAPHRLGLLGHPHAAHAALADLLEQLVGADARARLFDHGWSRESFRHVFAGSRPSLTPALSPRKGGSGGRVGGHGGLFRNQAPTQ